MSAPDLHILERICVDGVCHCDWRLTLVNCAERKAMVIIHGINVGMSGITLLLGKQKTLFSNEAWIG
jgi:hypothetical protein